MSFIVVNIIYIIILYEYYKWILIHTENGNFNKRGCPEVGMIGPAIYFKDIEESPDENIDPFKAFEILASPFICLNLIHIENFSLALKLSKQKDT